MVFARGLRAARQLVPSARAARSMSAAASFSSFGSSSSASSALSSSARASRAPLAARLSTPAHVQGDVTAIVAGVAAVGAIIGVGKMWWDASSGSSASYAPVASFQELSQRDIATFFKELTAEVQNLFKQLPEIENAVRTYMANNNITLGDAEFQQAMLQQLFQMMEALEAQVVGKRGWSRESLEHALEKFAKDPEIVQLQEELNALMQTVFPKPEPVDIPDSLTPEKTIEILAELVKGMEKAMREMLNHARAEGITDPAKAMEEFQYLYLEHVEQLTTAQMKLHGVSQQAFTAALSKYHSESEQFRQQIEKIYQEQAKVFKKMGLEVESP